MKSIYLTVLCILMYAIAVHGYCQEAEAPRVWVLKGDGEVSVLPAPTPTPTLEEIVIDLPGLPEDATPLVLVRIPAGSFMMGAYPGEQARNLNECPQHPVTISQDYYFGKYELTKAQWSTVMGTTPWSGSSRVIDASNSSAVHISWNDCQLFINTLNKLGQGTFRLPTEAEWEYACRAGTTTRFYWGDDPLYSMLEDYAWYVGDTYYANESYAHIVGLKLPNAWGLYDVCGNVWEWCQDYWHDDYTGAPENGSAWELPTNSDRVFRGGFWLADIRYCRSAARCDRHPDHRYYNLGMRVVREAD